MIKAVIFDMDGVIVDSEPLWQRMLPLYLHTKGITFKYDKKSLQLINLHFRGRRQKYITGILKKKFQITDPYHKILNDRLHILFGIFRHSLKSIPGTIPFIKKLHASGYPLVLASSSPHRVIRYVLKKFHLKKYFKFTVSGDDVQRGKPHPEIFLKSAQLLRTKPSEILVIEDSISGILAAHRAGMKCIALKQPYTPKKYLNSATLVVHRLSAISLQTISHL